MDSEVSGLHCGFPGPGPGSEQGSCVVYDEWIEAQEALLGDLWRYACWLERLPSPPALVGVEFTQALFVHYGWPPLYKCMFHVSMSISTRD